MPGRSDTTAELRRIAGAIDRSQRPSLSAVRADIMRLVTAYEERAVHVVRFSWDDDLYVTTAEITPSEFKQLKGLIKWLRERAGEQWGKALARITAVQLAEGTEVESDQHHQDFGSLMDDVALQTRYFETGTPGDFYGDRHPLLDAHPS